MTEPERITVDDVRPGDIVMLPDVDRAQHHVINVGVPRVKEDDGFGAMRVLIYKDKPEVQNMLRYDRAIERWGHEALVLTDVDEVRHD